MQIRYDQLDRYYIDEIVYLTVAAGAIASTDATLPQTFRNTPTMAAFPPHGFSGATFSISYSAGTPKLTISASSVDTSLNGQIVPVRIIACDLTT